MEIDRIIEAISNKRIRITDHIDEEVKNDKLS